MNKPDLALNNLQWLIYHKTKPNISIKLLYIMTKITEESTSAKILMLTPELL